MSKFCTKCGKPVADTSLFCTNCGSSSFATGNGTNNSSAGIGGQFRNLMSQAEDSSFWDMGGDSKWDGGVLETFITGIVVWIMIMFTCGIATPWAICYMWSFIIGHTMIDGRRLTFDGTGAQLFGNWIKWLVLIVITCGIYSFWVAPRLYHWVAKHTHIL